MNSREAVLAAMRRQPVDRVPTDIWATAEVWQKLRDHFGDDADIRSELQIDGMASVGPDYVGPALPEMPAGESVDYWGMRRRQVAHEGGAYNEQYFHPLAEARSVDDLDAYLWPRPEWFDYSRMRERALEARKVNAVQCGYMAPFYYHNLLRGLEQSLLDPLTDETFTHEFLTRLSDCFYDHHRRMFEACRGLIDIAQVTDDLGSQTGPLIGMDLYREFYAPHHHRFIELCHEFDIAVMHHDDGSCRLFLPLLIDMGIDMLNPVQWVCPGMDMVELKAEFGDRISFHGAVENQRILPFGTVQQVRDEVRHCIDSLASDGTGYILAPCHNLQVNTPVENIIAMYDEAATYGRT
ncbi:MAG TPA: uroporphyrinogen decarboxylase family protein [Candidatus Latescibacteria bacterium]|jgi:uroporphyrinogen decarboxylase|nr:uroporphyrinogen-III decarboxylase-like protein [Gemmatimonadaceae bacterium]MDP6017135.1 uroporphyrinogen decarboxylase family protein [Candidatus Latescibacterota bacterium]HJP29817.1 uroporphyrinogen decarboxylase family protein [Candidatus Latescibacterota bacterium]